MATLKVYAIISNVLSFPFSEPDVIGATAMYKTVAVAKISDLRERYQVSANIRVSRN